jgi:hypothetical protein
MMQRRDFFWAKTFHTQQPLPIRSRSLCQWKASHWQQPLPIRSRSLYQLDQGVFASWIKESLPVEAKPLERAVANWIKKPLPVRSSSLCQWKASQWQQPLPVRSRNLCQLDQGAFASGRQATGKSRC